MKNSHFSITIFSTITNVLMFLDQGSMEWFLNGWLLYYIAKYCKILFTSSVKMTKKYIKLKKLQFQKGSKIWKFWKIYFLKIFWIFYPRLPWGGSQKFENFEKCSKFSNFCKNQLFEKILNFPTFAKIIFLF